ncbi:MAG: HlyD family secretion protein [Sandaracinaceae bacterium]
MTSLKKHYKKVLFALALAAMLAFIVKAALDEPGTLPRAVDVAYAQREEPDPPGADPLVVDRPEGDLIGGLGVVEPAAPESRLVAGVPGRVHHVHVDEGDTVEAGALLVELESGPEEAALAAAEADVEVALAELARTRRGLRPEESQALAAEAEAAMARASLAEGSLTRLEAAASGGGVSRDQVERARQDAAAAHQTADAAAARERAAGRGRREDISVAQANLQAARARLDQARANLEQRRIVAPTLGEILEVHYRVGEYTAPGGAEPVIVMGDTSTLRARVDVDERDVGRLREGARAVITVDAFPGRRYEGHVVEIARRMGRKNIRTDEPTERIDTKILEVVVELEAPEGLFVGQRVMAYITAAER